MENKTFIQEGFKTIFESPDLDESFVREMVDPSYIQHVDGKTLGFEEFVRHLKLLKEKTQSIKVDFKALATEGEIVFSNHVVTATMKNGTKTIIHIMAEFRVRNGKMYYCDELTFLSEGDSENSDLGSVTK